MPPQFKLTPVAATIVLAGALPLPVAAQSDKEDEKKTPAKSAETQLPEVSVKDQQTSDDYAASTLLRERLLRSTADLEDEIGRGDRAPGLHELVYAPACIHVGLGAHEIEEIPESLFADGVTEAGH